MNPRDEVNLMTQSIEAETYIERLRQSIVNQYEDHPTGCGGSFGELLSHEIHTQGMTFNWLAEKWGISLPTLGRLIWDHCERLQEPPFVDHDYSREGR